MKRIPVILLFAAMFLLQGCPRREQPPASAYDPELLETARAVSEAREAEEQAAEDQQVTEQAGSESPAECTRQEGGCPEGYVCWDSYYCKRGFSDQCSAAGDKRCHKRCTDDADCPPEMPRCRTKPIFSGSDRGIEEKFCVGRDQ